MTTNKIYHLKANAIRFMLFLGMLQGAGLPARSETSTASSTNQACEPKNLIRYDSITSSVEREFFILTLIDCPYDSRIANLLEKAILNDDILNRQAAWKSYRSQLSPKSQDFLKMMYFRADLHEQESGLLIEYLASIAQPKNKNDLELVFLRSFYHKNKMVQGYSLIGLGKIRSSKTSQMVAIFLGKKEFIEEDELIALEALYYQKSDFSLRHAKQKIYSQNPEIQRKSMDLLASIDSKMAWEELLVLYQTNPQPANQAYLYNLIQKKGHQILRLKPGIVREPIRIYQNPSDRAPIVAVLDKNAIVYVKDITNHHFRKYLKAQDNKLVENPYMLIYTNQGLEGWIFKSGFEVIDF